MHFPVLNFFLIICRSIVSTAEMQFQIHWGLFGLSSHLDSPAFEMDLKLFRGRRENQPTNNDFVHQAARYTGAKLADKVKKVNTITNSDTQIRYSQIP